MIKYIKSSQYPISKTYIQYSFRNRNFEKKLKDIAIQFNACKCSNNISNLIVVEQFEARAKKAKIKLKEANNKLNSVKRF